MSEPSGSHDQPDVASAVQTLDHIGELDAILEAITDGVFIYDAQGYIHKINTAGKQLLGIEQFPEYQTTRPEDRASLFQSVDTEGRPLASDDLPVRRLLQGEELRGADITDVRVQTIDGRVIILSITGAPIRDEKGAITGAVAIIRDVTERRQAERRAHETLQTLLELAEAVVLLPQATTPDKGDSEAEENGSEDDATDEANVSTPSSPLGERVEVQDIGNTTRSKESAAEHLVGLIRRALGIERIGIALLEPGSEVIIPAAAVGLTAEQEVFWRERLAGALLSDLLPDEALRERLCEDEPIVLDTHHPAIHAHSASLGIRWLLIAPMRLGAQMIGLLLLDVGHYAGQFEGRHRSSPELIALAGATAKLAALVIERERLLTERAEEQTRRLALADANQRMDEFLAIASHELKTPLTAIKANIQLAIRSIQKRPANKAEANELQSVATNLLSRTERQVTRLNRLVDDLLDVSRIQADRLTLRLEACDLRELAREVVEEQRRAEPTRTITLTLPQRPVPLLADPDRVRQVITNFVTNALKYAPPDRPIAVMLTIARRRARLAVRDEGPGLPPEEQTHIWERFHRAPGIEQQGGSGVGLGLGLHISKTIVEVLGGHVGVESAVGVGSTFWFTLPLAGLQPA